jgi:flagellar biosynthesis anti-sigma factor FlgM
MRIDLNSGAAITGSQVEKTSSPRSTHATAAASSDKPQLSESDLSIGKLTAAALNSPEVRSEKIQALQSQLTSGTYHIPANQIASSLLEQIRVRTS